MIDEILSWVGTPYHHQARIKGVGVDCANLIAAIAEYNGHPAIKLEAYSNQWHLHNSEDKMINILTHYGCKRVDELKPGAIVTFQYGKVSGHVGIMVSNDRVVHADYRVGKVVNVMLTGDLQRRLSGIWELP